MKAKLKTRKSAAKRFKRSANGKLMHSSIGLHHLKISKGGSRVRSLQIDSQVGASDRKRIEQMVGGL